MGTADSSARIAHSIAICGNPNSGKTTIFNHITGLNQKVGNYSGVTVDKVAGTFRVAKDDPRRFELVDIPGTYSLAAFSPDEYIAVQALCGGPGGTEAPDVMIAVIDTTHLERGLYLVLQLLQIGRPLVVALNMSDLARRRGISVDYDKLNSRLGGVPVIPVVGTKGRGITELKEAAIKLIGSDPVGPPLYFDNVTDGVIDELATHSAGTINRAVLIRVIFDEGGPAEKAFIAQSGDQANTTQIIELLKAGRKKIRAEYGVLHVAESQVLTTEASAICKEAVSVQGAPKQTRSERIDRFILNPFLGPVLLVVMMSLVFQSIFSWSEPLMELIDISFGALALYVEGIMPEGPLQSLLTDGIIGGVGSVLIFLPQIAILFLFIALLEDSGYISRAAFLVDRMFRWCGLSGKSFIPMLSSFACSVPGILATRTIEDRKLRFITILVAPLMPCSARLPVYAIMIAAFIPHESYLGIFSLQGLVLTALYMLGIVVAVFVSFILQKTMFKTEQGTFMMEMPSYKLPGVKSILIRVVNRSKSFIVRAGTVIFAITILIWALSYFPRSDEVIAKFEMEDQVRQEQFLTEQLAIEEALATHMEQLDSESLALLRNLDVLSAETSSREALDTVFDQATSAKSVDSIAGNLLYQLRLSAIQANETATCHANELSGTLIRDSYFGRMGRTVAPVFKPLGWDWRITMAVLSSFPAREVIIATLGTIYNLGSETNEESQTLVQKMRNSVWDSGELKGQPVFGVPVALSIMVFFALCCQCWATVVTVRHETRSWYYALGLFTYMTVIAYVLALAAYNIAIFAEL